MCTSTEGSLLNLRLRRHHIELFEEETGVEVWFQGRSGRHCTVELNKHNILHYEELKEKALQYEKGFVETINNME